MKVLLSIKPEYAEKILYGGKKYEFRRTIFKSPSVTKIVIYATSPVRKVIGEFDIDCIISLEIDNLWEKTKHHAGINRSFTIVTFMGKKSGTQLK